MGLQRRTVLGGTSTAVAGLLAGCSLSDGRSGDGSSTGGRTTVAVGSKPFAEQRILGYMAYEVLSSKTDLITVDEMGTGESVELWNDVLDGTIGAYWEYTGTIWELLLPGQRRKIQDPQRLYEAVAEKVEEKGAVYLDRAPVNNTWALAVRAEWADRTGVGTVSELAEYANREGTDVEVAIGEDFEKRDDGWAALLEYYGFEDDAVSRSGAGEDVTVVSIGLTYQLLAQRKVDVAMAFRTDPQIREMDLVVLDDDRSFFVPYDPAPLVDAELVADHPVVRDSLNPIGQAIGDVETMRRLNAKVVLRGEQPRRVAREFLEAEGLV